MLGSSRVRCSGGRPRSEKQAEEVGQKIKLVVENYLALNLNLLGFIPIDNHVPESVAAQKPFVLLHPRCRAALNLMMLARSMLKLPVRTGGNGSLFRNLFAKGDKVGEK